MSKQWNVKIDEQSYDVALKNANKLMINGEELKLKAYKKKTGLVHTEYEVPVGTKTALLIIRSMGTPQLIIDNKDCATGEDYVPVKLPKWAYIFIVLHCINVLNGALGIFLAIAGVTWNDSIILYEISAYLRAVVSSRSLQQNASAYHKSRSIIPAF